MGKKLFLILGFLVVTVILTTCGPSQAELDAQATEIAADVFATQTAEAPTVAPTPSPTATLTPTLTPTPTITPTPTPDLNGAILTIDDLPPVFNELSQDMLEAIGAAPPSEIFFAFYDEEHFHLILGLPYLLATQAEQLEFDAGLGDVDIFMSEFATGMGIVTEDSINKLGSIPDAEGIGDASAGITMVVESDDGIIAMRVDFVLFRRGRIAVGIMVAYIEGDPPLVSVVDLARVLDARIVENFAPHLVGLVATDLGGQEVRFAVGNAYRPFSYIDPETMEAVGWDYDAGRALCEKLNCTPIFMEATWEGLFEAVAVGEYDVSFEGIVYSEERSRVVQFGNPYFVFGQVILIRADDVRPELDTEESLLSSNLNIGSQLGTAEEITAIQLVGEERVIGFEQLGEPVDALIVGDVDTAILDEITAIIFMQLLHEEIRIAFSVTNDLFLAPIYPPDSDLVLSFNWAFEELFADGTIDEICEKWLFRPCQP